MHLSEAKALCRKIKTAIQWNNDHANWRRVGILKNKKRQLRNKIVAFELNEKPYISN